MHSGSSKLKIPPSNLIAQLLSPGETSASSSRRLGSLTQSAATPSPQHHDQPTMQARRASGQFMPSARQREGSGSPDEPRRRCVMRKMGCFVADMDPSQKRKKNNDRVRYACSKPSSVKPCHWLFAVRARTTVQDRSFHHRAYQSRSSRYDSRTQKIGLRRYFSNLDLDPREPH